MTYQLRALNTRQTNPNLVEWLNIAGHQARTNRSPELDGNLSSNQRAPSYDLRQTPSQIEIKLAMPGVSPENLEVTIKRRRLTISGRAETDASNDSSQLLHQGLGEGHFEKIFELTEDADPDAIRASIKFGLVTIEIPRLTDHLPRRIAVEH